MDVELPIIYSIDDNYAQHCAAGMASLLANISSKYKVHIFILTGNLSAENREKLIITSSLKACELTFIEVHDHELDGLHIPPPWSKAILYRLKIPTLLEKYSKAIYLDADTIVEGDMVELFDVDLRDKFLAAVDELDLNKTSTYFQIQRIGTPLENGYFNSGVLPLNLEKMRAENFEKQCLSLIFSEKRHRLTFPDQDALNMVAGGNYLHLPPIWNLEVGYADGAVLGKYRKSAKIFHFACLPKPWHIGDSFFSRYHPHPQINLSSKYYRYLRLTPWKGFKAKGSTRILCKKFLSLFDLGSVIAKRKMEKRIEKIVNAKIN
ncbi:MAG: glycosyltransferase family 8 protein [Puniceicoccales bacterium]|nr:glycosyltransferase family 8 protein [Puniceicoccales bacterium]